MEPIKPLPPMAALDPIKADAWWPAELGTPSSSGSANSVRYAYFPATHSLLIERDGKCQTFDTGDLEFHGVVQSSSGNELLNLLTQNGSVAVDSLRKL